MEWIARAVAPDNFPQVSGPHRPIADPGVPATKKLLRRVPPGTWDKQLQLHAHEALAPRPSLGERDEGAADPDTTMHRIRHQHAELPQLFGEPVEANGSHDYAVKTRHGEFLVVDDGGHLGN